MTSIKGLVNKKFLLISLLLGFLLIVSPSAFTETTAWPPQLGKAYPNLDLTVASGKAISLSSFKGKVILIEPIGMNCPACQAFSGAHRLGSLGKIKPQPGLASIEEYFPIYTGGVKITDERIVFIQLLLYNLSMQAPTAQDVKTWNDHFKYSGKNRVVLAGSKNLIGQASFDMIPGFQLIDQNFILRSDSTGAVPRHNLYEQLMPMVKKVLESK